MHAGDLLLGNLVVGRADRGSMTPGAIRSINDLPDVYTVLKTCKHALMASCKSCRNDSSTASSISTRHVSGSAVQRPGVPVLQALPGLCWCM